MSEFENVHTMTDYWDGPRRGIADFQGEPHLYESQFSETDDDWTDIFHLSPISPELFDLALESWSIWLRWKAAYERGETTHDTHPALPTDRLKRNELEPILKDRLIIDKTNFLQASVEFRGAREELEARWTPIGLNPEIAPMLFQKPLLLLDIDGVLSPFGAGLPPGFTSDSLGGYEVIWSEHHKEWLSQLGEIFELVWATTWEHSANESMSVVLELGELPVVEFDRGTGDTWKLPSVMEYIADRPAAWIDDDLFLDAFAWASEREAQTLLVRTSSSLGMTSDHFEELLAFGETTAE